MMIKSTQWARFVVGPLLMAGGAIQAIASEGRAPPKELRAEAGYVMETLQYRVSDELRANQVLAVYPQQHTSELPMVVFIHGGGWKKGDKDQMAWMCQQYAKNGYFAASISYRLKDEAPFPACIYDAKEAIRFIKDRCAKGHWPGDVERLGVMGFSAGAHLALMIALTPDQGFFKSDRYSDQDSRVSCAVGVSTPTDFVSRLAKGKSLELFSEEQKSDMAFVKRVSPLYHVHGKQVPILMLHGSEDKIVEPVHYTSFQQACESSGVKNFQLHLDKAGHHSYFFKHREHRNIMDRFFENHLKKPAK